MAPPADFSFGPEGVDEPATDALRGPLCSLQFPVLALDILIAALPDMGWNPTVGEMCSQNVRPFLVDVINLMIIAAWMQSPNTLHVCTNLLLGSLAAVCLFTWRCTDCNHSNASYHG
jgi:hypothetical protein